MTRTRLLRHVRNWLALVCLAATLTVAAARPALAQVDTNTLITKVLTQLNTDMNRVTDDSKSYKIVFDAFLKLSAPPFEIGRDFNHATIHPKMATWSAVSGWAESNPGMAQAVLACKNKSMFGLPYGKANVSPNYQSNNLFVDIAVGGSLRDNQFPYLKAIDTVAAYVTAEVYRLMEAGRTQQGIDLAIAHCFMVRQLCDREFLIEKLHSIDLLSDNLGNLRDVFYLYQDRISAAEYSNAAINEFPFLRPDRNRLFMPEADRIVSEALLDEVFDPVRNVPNAEKFTETFTEIQSKDAALTRFGAARRWRHIAALHGSLAASRERLKTIYDDWWRRWRIQAYDDILSVDTEFERTNPIRYAAVVYSLEDVEELFEVRNLLIAEVNGTAIAAALCAYKKTYGTYPEQVKMTYTQFMRKRSDSDPWDTNLGPMEYMLLTSDHAVDLMTTERLWIKAGEALLWAQGQDHQDNRAERHSHDGAIGDFVLWPPIKAVAREQGFME